MEETKRKTKTSAAVKNRYNAKAYDRIAVCAAVRQGPQGPLHRALDLLRSVRLIDTLLPSDA